MRLRDIRASIFGLPAGSRIHVGATGVPGVTGTEIEGLRTTFALPRESGAHASG